MTMVDLCGQKKRMLFGEPVTVLFRLPLQSGPILKGGLDYLMKIQILNTLF